METKFRRRGDGEKLVDIVGEPWGDVDRSDGRWLGIEPTKGTRTSHVNRWISRNPLRAILIACGLVFVLGTGTRLGVQSYSAHRAAVAASKVNEAEATWRENLDRQVAEMQKRKAVEVAPQVAVPQVSVVQPQKQQANREVSKGDEKYFHGVYVPSPLAFSIGLSGEAARLYDERMEQMWSNRKSTSVPLANADSEKPGEPEKLCTLDGVIQNVDLECGVMYIEKFSIIMLVFMLVVTFSYKAWRLSMGD